MTADGAPRWPVGARCLAYTARTPRGLLARLALLTPARAVVVDDDGNLHTVLLEDLRLLDVGRVRECASARYIETDCASDSARVRPPRNGAGGARRATLAGRAAHPRREDGDA